MTYNEVREDYLLDRLVVIATERGRRPTDFAKQERETAKAVVCPLCPGNEKMTPPAVLVYLAQGEGIKKSADHDGYRHENWLVRCVPNLYPAFSPPKSNFNHARSSVKGKVSLAIGHHEVLVESPVHEEHPSDAKISQLTFVVRAYIDRLRELSGKPYVRYVSIFRNYGLEAGASLSHAHSQIIATNSIPRIPKEELIASRKFHEKTGECIFCCILKRELKKPRLILENADFTVFAPWASVHPMEFWIAPKRHAAAPLDMTNNEIQAFAETLKVCLNGLKRLANDPPYNYGFHLAINKDAHMYYHWHLEVYPKLAVWAGFEKSTGMYINTVAPEMAAKSLREAILD